MRHTVAAAKRRCLRNKLWGGQSRIFFYDVDTPALGSGAGRVVWTRAAARIL